MSDAIVQTARQAARAGQIPKAIEAYRAALKANPRDPETLAELASLLAGAGDASGALAALVRAARINPDYQTACVELVAGLVSAGQKTGARKAIDAAKPPGPVRKALLSALKSGRPAGGTDDLRALVEAIREQDVPRARAVGDAILARDGDVPLALNLRGVVEIQAGDPAAAEEFLRRGLAADPGMVELSSNLGYAQLLQGKFDAAIATLQGVVRDTPGASDARINLASALYRADRPDEALAQLEALPGDKKSDATARRILVQCLYKVGRAGKALEMLQKIEKAEGGQFDQFMFTATLIEETQGPEAAIAYLKAWAPRSIPARLRLAGLAAELGDLTAAGTEYRAILKADPRKTEALYLLAMQDRLLPDDPIVKMMEGLADDGTLAPVERAHLHYGLAKSMLDGGRNSEAFAHLRAANAAQTPETGDRGRALGSYLSVIRETWDADRIRDYTQSDTAELAPIFIFGIQRSGSTLTEQILSAHAEVTGLGEQSLFYYGLRDSHKMDRDTFSRTVAKLASDLRSASPTPRMVDKFLGNFRQLGAIAAAFPNAILINPRRDPRSIALSVYQNRFDPKTFRWATTLEDIAQYYLEYDRHMDHWKSVLGDRLVQIHYEDLVSDTEKTIRGLLDACRLDWDPACLRPELVKRRVDTLSIGQVRKSIHSGSRKRWRVFEEELEPFTTALREAGKLPADPDS
jgi:tetratricopeptide (TPR) repeat protein